MRMTITKTAAEAEAEALTAKIAAMAPAARDARLEAIISDPNEPSDADVAEFAQLL